MPLPLPVRFACRPMLLLVRFVCRPMLLLAASDSGSVALELELVFLDTINILRNLQSLLVLISI